MELNVVDSIMGSGKSSWAIKYMNANINKKFIYITPFLDEVDRIKKECIDRKFKEPLNRGKGKLSGFKELLRRGCNIASTHVLFSYADDEIKELIKLNGYILILDEVMEVIEPLKIDKTDLDMLFNEGLLILNDDKENTLSWRENNECYNGEFKNLKIMVEHGRVIYYKDNVLMWRFPVDVFDVFSEVWVLTYLFDGQIQKAYYDLYDRKYNYYCIENGELSDYKSTKLKNTSLINIYEGKLNEIGSSKGVMSFTWYMRNKNNSEVLVLLKNNRSNFLKNICKSKSKEAMWTTYKDYINAIKDRNYNTKSFVVHNARATNLHRERKHLAYMVNRFINPVYKMYFKDNGVELNDDLFSLSELLQWIWRSAIREGNEIQLYIPSKRMRNLLKDWLKN